MIWIIAALVFLAVFAGAAFLKHALAEAFRGWDVVFRPLIQLAEKPPPDPRREALDARLKTLGPDSSLRDWLALRREIQDAGARHRIRTDVARRPFLDEEVAALLAAPGWPDRLLALEAVDLIRGVVPATADLVVSTVRDFVRSFPTAGSGDPKRDLEAAESACEALYRKELPDEFTAHELLWAVRGLMVPR